MPDSPTMYRLWVHMADDEWSSQEGGRKMDNLAMEYADKYPDKRPLTVTVHEHGGWWLSFLFAGSRNGMLVGTANDRAKLLPAQECAIEHFRHHKPEYLGSIRRNDLKGDKTNG